MTFQVGRFDLNEPPQSVRFDTNERGADVMSCAGWLRSTSSGDTDHAIVIREGLRGLRPGDVVPIIADYDSTLDGFYRIQQVTVDPVVAPDDHCYYNLTAERVPGGASSAAFEVRYSSGIRTNGELTGGTYPDDEGLGFAPAARLYANDGDNVEYDVDDFAGGTGEVRIVWGASGAGSGSSFYGVTPANFYEGAARVERDVGGTYYPVEGRQSLDADPTDIRLNNGMLRFDVSNTSSRLIRLQRHGNSDWGSVQHEFEVKAGQAFASGPPVIIRNTPEAVTVRWAMGRPTVDGSYFLYATLRRGARFVECSHVDLDGGTTGTNVEWQDGTPTTQQMSAWWTSGDAGANIIASFSDTDGGKVNMLAPYITGSADTGGVLDVETNSTDTADFALGISLAAENHIGREYFAAISEAQRVVS